ncbi:hypothetical protein [Vulgatibacter sp.]|uniref:hypothetical protein n=1 Tax=Vulgatibacter sp. TaxID=1971226 RepID=UPI0035617510
MTTPPRPPPAFDLHDLVALLGLILFAGGLWWIYPPLALVVVGALLMAAAFFGTARRGVK